MHSEAARAGEGRVTRISVSGEERAPLCGMGICYECEGTCATLASRAQGVATELPARHATVVVVGAGPAGLAAARAAGEAGVDVTLVDDNPAIGGQIWRGAAVRALPARVSVLTGTRIVDAEGAGRLRAHGPEGVYDLHCERLVLATGARERFLPFPGWTLPHVTGAGGLQALAKAGLVDVAERRVLVAGTGPLLLPVAAYLRAHGARVVAIVEQASVGALARFAVRLPWGKLREGVGFARALRGIPLWTSAWVAEAVEGGAKVARRRGRVVEVACDFVACGYHLVPNTELALLLGCATQNGLVTVNDRQQTSTDDVYCAGEPTGIGGVERAEIEGTIAGLCAATGEAPPPGLLAWRARYLRFAERLAAATALRGELRRLARPETLVCRCEDVTYARMAAETSWREAKLQTRCGMGPCQGRVCGAAAAVLFGWSDTPATLAPRPPLFPCPVAALAPRA